MNSANRNVGHRSFRTLMKSFVAIGATSALMLAGLAFVAASPASAAGAPNKLVFTGEPSSTATAGSSAGLSTVAVSVEDASNAVDTTGAGSSDVITLVANGSPSMTGNVVAAVNGVATFSSLVIDTAGTYTFTATDSTTSGLTSGTSTPPVAVSAAGASKIAFTTAPPANATIGVALTPAFKVSVEDTHGNVVTTGAGSVDTITISTSAGCSVAGTVANVPAAGGVATFSNVNIATGTSCALTATDTLSPDNGFPAVTSAFITVATSTPTKLGFTTEPSATATAGTVLPSFIVSIEESNGIPVTGIGATDVVTLTSTCALTGTTTATAVAGGATFNLVTIKTGTSCTLVATDSTRTLATASSTAIAVLAGAATKVAYTTAPPTSVTTASTVLTAFKVSVEDVNDNVVTTGIGATDTITITSPCALGGTLTAGAVAGVATFSALTVNVTGACVLTATDSARALTVATATTTVGTPQATLVLTSVKGTVGKTLNLATTGGTGTGTLSYTVAAGSSAGCTKKNNKKKSYKKKDNKGNSKKKELK
jgi:hypothetical protein